MDRNTLTASAQLRHALTPRTTLVVSADVLEDRFFSQPPPLPNVRRSYRFLGGLEFGERAIVSGRLLAGMREFPGTLAQGSPPYRGPILTADLTVPLGSVASPAPPGPAGRALRVEPRGGGPACATATPSSTSGSSARRSCPSSRRGRPRSSRPASSRRATCCPIPTAARTGSPTASTTASRASAGLVQRLGDRVRIGGHVLWARRVSSLPYFSYEGLRYGVNAEIVP